MKNIIITILLTTTLFGLNKSVKDGKILSTYPWCYISGNNLTKTYKTNYIVKLKDEIRAYSAIRYLASDYDNIKKDIIDIWVVDIKTNRLIDAKSAYYVVNSKIKGSYSKYSKLAFANKLDAKEFVSKHGGDIRDFGFTLYLATRDLDNDNLADKKRIKKAYFRGHKIYDKMCNNIDISKSSIYEYMSYIKKSNICSKLKDKDLQALAIYLKDKNLYKKTKIKSIEVPKDAKCPVCGMYVYKYPKWSALAKCDKHSHYFDGNKDFFKFVLEPSRFGHDGVLTALYVTDYYTLKQIDAISAYYVVGSNVLGPMGHELISFEKLKDAKNFKREHLGKKILRYSEINKKIVYNLN
jgi:nitrous oxide reductase accessory protein NosL